MEKQIQIPKIFKEGQFIPKEERLAVQQKKGKLFIGIPKESAFQENRIALTPSSVTTLINHGHRVVIETGAGEKSNFSDHNYSEAGADIAYSKEQVFKAKIILKALSHIYEYFLFRNVQNALVFSPSFVQLMWKKQRILIMRTLDTSVISGNII